MSQAAALSPLLQATWAQSTPLTGLDKSLANLLHSKQPSDDPRHLWLAALTSHQWGRGHACLDLATLQTQAAALLGWNDEQVAALPTDLHQATSTLPWTQGEGSPLVLTEDTQGARLYLRRAWTAEQNIRQNIAQRLALPCDVPADLQQRLDALFTPTNNNEPDMQRLACEVAAQNRITLITGGPGTGKTTTVVKLLSLLVGTSSRDLQIHLAAPTGKAAARLTESISKALTQMPADVRARIPTQAQTLHRLLQTNSKATQVHQLATNVVVVDEASMIDLEMMARLLQAVPPTARLILLGDKDQLASVEAGAVMSQLCTGSLLKAQTVTLIHSHRFDAKSGIGQWARTVNADAADNTPALKALWNVAPDWLATLPLQQTIEGDAAEPDVTRLQLTSASDPKLAVGLRYGWRNWLALLDAHRPSKTAPAAPCSDAQAVAMLKAFTEFCVLCAVREGPLGVVQLNAQVEHALGLGQSPWYAGRPVMVTRNDYALELMNGDIGLCLPGPDGMLRVAFPAVDGGVRWVMPSRLDSVETVFAMTVHKSQGSEFMHVLLVIPGQESPVLTRELVYTGLTRARQRLTMWAPLLGVLWNGCARRVLRSGGLTN
ncbi:exodeoxyribonuclease V subunit alpha [Limnohabitans sp. INBF002]|uniref:exodeoxyribonuclease V subunit alpha n=1 Tax=Limnohabitans sp. INBF002 TaxID=2986280 RepID=UPI002377424E|nr:exodeoxyribonuclease V subunit alpha [Limnohabitans sp. INBF002]BDU52322.1 RecBCD enzyme subunit RecD [Limnohabitans sp. INBF002]